MSAWIDRNLIRAHQLVVDVLHASPRTCSEFVTVVQAGTAVCFLVESADAPLALLLLFGALQAVVVWAHMVACRIPELYAIVQQRPAEARLTILALAAGWLTVSLIAGARDLFFIGVALVALTSYGYFAQCTDPPPPRRRTETRLA